MYTSRKYKTYPRTKNSSKNAGHTSRVHVDSDDKNYQSDFSELSDSDDFNSESERGTSEDLARNSGVDYKNSHHSDAAVAAARLAEIYGSKPKYVTQANGTAKFSSKDNSLFDRAKSVRRIKVNELHNEIQLLQLKLKEVETENKLLKRTQRRQAIALRRYEGSDGEFPSILRSHEEEVRSLKEQLRKVTEKFRGTDRKLRETSDELERTKMQLQRLQMIVQDNSLEERNELAKKADTLQSELENKDKMIQDLQKHLELMEKNYKHQLSIEFARHRETKKQTLELQSQIEKLNSLVKDKERELEVRNIYSQRTNKCAKSQTYTFLTASTSKSSFLHPKDNYYRRDFEDSSSFSGDRSFTKTLPKSRSALIKSEMNDFSDKTKKSEPSKSQSEEKKGESSKAKSASPDTPKQVPVIKIVSDSGAESDSVLKEPEPNTTHPVIHKSEESKNGEDKDMFNLFSRPKEDATEISEQLPLQQKPATENRRLSALKINELPKIGNLPFMDQISSNHERNRLPLQPIQNSQKFSEELFSNKSPVDNENPNQDRQEGNLGLGAGKLSFLTSVLPLSDSSNSQVKSNNKIPKSNLMEELFGNTEKSNDRELVDIFKEPLCKSRTRPHLFDTNNVTDSNTNTVKAVDLFNNNRTSSGLLSRRQRERQNLLPRQVVNHLPGGLEEDSSVFLS